MAYVTKVLDDMTSGNYQKIINDKFNGEFIAD